MVSFEARPDGHGKWIITVDGVEHSQHYTMDEYTKLYEELWWESEREMKGDR